MIVRPTTGQDLPAIAELIETMGGHEQVTATPGWSSLVGESLGGPSIRCLVAQDGADVVGWAEVHARPNPSSGQREAWLCGLAVAPDKRGRGIGRRLLEAVEVAAADLGCDAVWLETSQWRESSLPFYGAFGYAERTPARRLHKDLSVPADAELEDHFLRAASRAAAAVRGAVVLADPRVVSMGADGLPTTGMDHAAEVEALRVLQPLGLPVVSEESGFVHGEVRDGQAWICLDPLDGTRNARAGGGPHAFVVGLVRDGVVLAGLVCELTTDTRWWARRGGPAWRDGRTIRASAATGLVAVPSVGDNDNLPALPPWTSRVRMSGSTAVDLCRVADGSLAAFVSTQRLVVHHHDLAGPLAVLEASGALVRSPGGSLVGSPAIFPDPAATFPLVAAAPQVAKDLITLVAGQDLSRSRVS